MTEKLKDILNNDKGKRTAFDLIAGIIVYDILALLIGGIVRIFFDYLFRAYALGILIGMAVAVFMVVHMYTVLEKAVLCDKKNAKRKTKLGAFLRMLVMAAALAVSVLIPQYLSIIGVFLGIFALKIAALTQPLIDRFILKFVKKEE